MMLVEYLVVLYVMCFLFNCVVITSTVTVFTGGNR